MKRVTDENIAFFPRQIFNRYTFTRRIHKAYLPNATNFCKFFDIFSVYDRRDGNVFLRSCGDIQWSSRWYFFDILTNAHNTCLRIDRYLQLRIREYILFNRSAHLLSRFALDARYDFILLTGPRRPAPSPRLFNNRGKLFRGFDGGLPSQSRNRVAFALRKRSYCSEGSALFITDNPQLSRFFPCRYKSAIYRER